MKKKIKWILMLCLILLLLFGNKIPGYEQLPEEVTNVLDHGQDLVGDLLNETVNNLPSGENTNININDIPEYSGDGYCIINNNEPYFTEAERMCTDEFEKYSKLDSLGRCGVAFANISPYTMPTEERGDIGHIHPSGWDYEGKSNNNKYDDLKGGGETVYNRCHLIGFQLAGENDNELNLVTGTTYMNHNDGMLSFENMIADYVKDTGNHVMYRVTPIYTGNNLVCDGVLMEAWSVEDEGDSICFNVFCYNVQPGIKIDYLTGQNWAD